MKNKYINFTIICLHLCLLFLMCTRNLKKDGTFRLRLAATVPASDAQAEVLQKFKQAVEAKSNRQIRVQIFLSGVLGSDTEILQKTQMNVIQACNISTSNAAIAIKKFKAFDLPYIFIDQDDNLRVFCDSSGHLGGPVTARLQSEADTKDLRLGLVMPILFRAAVMRKTMIRTPEDFAGIKMRTSASPIERAIVSAMGANPVTMGVSEVYTALQQGTVDGEGFPVVSIVAFRHHEAAKKISSVNFQGFAGVLLLNKQFYNLLPDSLQQVLSDAAAEVMQEASLLFKNRYQEAVNTLNDLDCEYVDLSSEQRQAFADITRKVLTNHEAEIGKEWIQTIQNRIKKDGPDAR